MDQDKAGALSERRVKRAVSLLPNLEELVQPPAHDRASFTKEALVPLDPKKPGGGRNAMGFERGEASRADQ